MRRYVHRSGGCYAVLHEALREADGAPLVVYQAFDPAAPSALYGPVWVRPTSEFHDGRFQEWVPPLVAGA